MCKRLLIMCAELHGIGHCYCLLENSASVGKSVSAHTHTHIASKSCSAFSPLASTARSNSTKNQIPRNVLFHNLKNMLNYILIYLQIACSSRYCLNFRKHHIFISQLLFCKDVIKFYYFILGE